VAVDKEREGTYTYYAEEISPETAAKAFKYIIELWR